MYFIPGVAEFYLLVFYASGGLLLSTSDKSNQKRLSAYFTPAILRDEAEPNLLIILIY